MSEPVEERGLPTAELVVDEDQMVARLRIHGYFHPVIDYQHLIGLLDGHGIVFGTDISAVQRLLERFRTSHGNASVEEIVAQGIRPTPSQDGKIDILIQPPAPVTIQEDGHADFRNINRFQAVASGAVLAKRTPAIPGKTGANIRGP
ncbi:MAG: FapA family protein [Spirochaetia bacterium]|nr:FapA family protein [Spirochaetia bacterium]